MRDIPASYCQAPVRRLAGAARGLAPIFVRNRKEDMSDRLIELGVNKLVTVTGRVRPGEAVVVVTDGTLDAIADMIAQVASRTGAEVVISRMTTRAQDGEEPPPPVAAAMREAGAATVAAQNDLSPDVLAQTLEELLGQPESILAMASCARSLAHRDARATIADLRESFAATTGVDNAGASTAAGREGGS